MLLLTAHRAKGLEFDDVVILDGGWDRPSRGEDADAPRRLFYVAMTRARRSLAVSAHGGHPFLSPQDAILAREVKPDTRTMPERTHHYVMPDLKLVDLSWAGRLRPGDPSLPAIAAAVVGEPVMLVRHDHHFLLRNASGQTLGRMSAAFSPPEGLTFLHGEVGAVIRWRKTDNSEEYRSHIRRDEWEVVVPELVFGYPGQRRSCAKGPTVPQVPR